MKFLLSIILWAIVPMLTPQGLQIGVVNINNKIIRIMKMNLNNPAFLQSAGNVVYPDFFYITSLIDGNQLSFDGKLLGKFAENVNYSVNSIENWEQMTSDMAITLNSGDTIYFDNHTGINYTPDASTLLKASGQFNAGGNVMKLLYPNLSSVPEQGLYLLFYGLPIVSAEKLKIPADAVGVSGCESMFWGCTSLTTAPELPATVLANNCYNSMFLTCTSLTTAPELPATILAEGCYASMFQGCTSLTTAPELPATVLAKSCYRYMFQGCTSLTTAPELPATVLAEECYSIMFQECTSLTAAPELPATVLANNCYNSMFLTCTSLTTAPELPATVLANGCYASMFQECTSLTTAPELPATVLVDLCYANMFQGCTSLTSVTCLATDVSASSCTRSWLTNVSVSGVFTKSSDMEEWQTGIDGIPVGWTVQDYVQ